MNKNSTSHLQKFNKKIFNVSECGPYKYGVHCTLDCGHCKHSVPCSVDTGNCSTGCQNGWSGAHCTGTYSYILLKC